MYRFLFYKGYLSQIITFGYINYNLFMKRKLKWMAFYGGNIIIIFGTIIIMIIVRKYTYTQSMLNKKEKSLQKNINLLTMLSC